MLRGFFGVGRGLTVEGSVLAQAQPLLPACPGAYAGLPRSFERNQGQTGSAVDFVSRGKGYTLFQRSQKMAKERSHLRNGELPGNLPWNRSSLLRQSA